MAPISLCVSVTGHQLVEPFGKDWEYGLVEGGMSLGEAFKKLMTFTTLPLCLPICGSRYELLDAAPAARLCLNSIIRDSESLDAQLNSSFIRRLGHGILSRQHKGN